MNAVRESANLSTGTALYLEELFVAKAATTQNHGVRKGHWAVWGPLVLRKECTRMHLGQHLDSIAF